jgi:predicted DNA binding CopG/RHH family protein
MRKEKDTLSELTERGAKVLEQLEPKRRKAIQMAKQQAIQTAKRQDIEMERQQEGGERTTKVTVRMPVDLVKALKHRAIDEGRTFQELVTEAVRKFLRQ